MSQVPTVATSAVYRRPRGFVAARGPDAASFLNRMLSNEIEGLPADASCEAMLLTPKARVIALLVVHRRSEDDFLLLTEPGLDEVVAQNLLQARFGARLEVNIEEHFSYVLLCTADSEVDGTIVIKSHEFGPGHEVVDSDIPAGVRELSYEEAEARRIVAGVPLFGREIDDRVLPAEAGLVERAVSFDKGCYPGQEPIARLHYRGHTNRGLRVLRLETDVLPEFDSEVSYDHKVVGRVTSAAIQGEEVVALAYVRNEVPADAIVVVDGVRASIIEAARP